jgi:hypothetical protein
MEPVRYDLTWPWPSTVVQPRVWVGDFPWEKQDNRSFTAVTSTKITITVPCERVDAMRPEEV